MKKARNKKSSKPTRNKGKSRKSPQKRSGLRRGLWIGLFLLVVASAAYLAYLDSLIRQRFAGDTWAHPSRVYARPLELYAGLRIKPQQLIDELKLGDYRPVKQVSAPGLFSRHGKLVDIHVRAFQFADHSAPAEHIRLRFDDDEIIEISSQSQNKVLDYFQLPPALIGSYLPANGEDRLVVSSEDIPQRLIDILLTVEDRHFYSHFGVNPLSIMRALMANIRAGKTVQGGSTLTQQLAKNMFLTPERSLIRKINEALLSLMLEMRFSKETILTAYINEVFLLQQKNTSVHGFALASKLLFKQPLNALSTERLALLVGMVKGPSIYNPILHPKNALKRRNQVLSILHEAGELKSDEYQRLRTRPLGTVSRLPSVNRFPAYLDLVKKQLKHGYSSDDLVARGLNIFTAFDPMRQAQLEWGLRKGLARFSDDKVQAAVIVADYLSGDLVALVGDRDTDFPGYNRAVMAQRQIGSLIKPMLLYSLLRSGNTLATLIEDRPIRIRQSDDKLWTPRNFDNKLHGTMTLYQAFIKSYNLPFVRLGVEHEGLKALVDNLQKINLLKQQTIYPSLLLGATAMTPFEVAQMYQAIASSGYFAPLTTIRQVSDESGRLLTRIPLSSASVYDRKSMIQVQRAMIGVAEQGTAKYLKQRFEGRSFAGKTGTTNDLRDSWFAGFGDRYLSVVWLGHDDNQPVGLTGSSGALRVWADIMQQVGDASLKLSPDPDLEWYPVDVNKGGLTKKHCDDSAVLPFPRGKEPDFSSTCKSGILEKGLEWLQERF